MNITRTKELAGLCPVASLLVLQYKVEVTKSSDEFLALFYQIIEDLNERYVIEDIAGLRHIKDTRSAYRQLGKSPSAYRNASEAMLRRIVRGNGLYEINNIVDINNYMSITTGYSIGSYDLDQLMGNIEWKPACKGEVYQGIGKETLAVEGFPTLYDQNGAFGNPTSDSQKAMVSLGKHRIMSVVYSFSGKDEFEESTYKYKELLSRYCGVEKVEVQIIGE